MSLLTSLIRASTQFQQAMERRQTPSTGPEAAPGKAQAKAMETEPTPGDDRFTPSENNQSDLSRLKARRLAMTDYKQTVGQDLAFVRETLRQQLNGLQDLVHRYDTMRRSVSAEQIEAAGNSRAYAFNLNARA